MIWIHYTICLLIHLFAGMRVASRSEQSQMKLLCTFMNETLCRHTFNFSWVNIEEWSDWLI